MEQGAIYYTCKEYDKNNVETFILRKCSINDGTLDFYIPGFHHVRGIARDNSDGSYYVVDSLIGNRVLKFDKDWNPLRKSNPLGCSYLIEPRGIVVDNGNILVCSKNKVIILDTTLKICYELELPLHSLIDITKFKGKYFLTTERAIIAISIDYSEFKFEVQPKTVELTSGCKLRGICSSKHHLYATETGDGGRLLCFKHQNDKLINVHAENKCSKFCSKHKYTDCTPVALAYHDDKVYYSQGRHEVEFYIVQLADGENFESKKLFYA